MELRLRVGLVVEVVVDDVCDLAAGVVAEVFEVSSVQNVVVDERDLRVVSLVGHHLIPEEDVIDVDLAVTHNVQENFSLAGEISFLAVDDRSPLFSVLEGVEIGEAEGADDAVHVAGGVAHDEA